jgi:hypothetical protein
LSWYRLSFCNDDVYFGAYASLIIELAQAYSLAGCPPGVAVFSSRTIEKEPDPTLAVWYLSPTAYTLFRPVIESRGFLARCTACLPPARHSVDLRIGDVGVGQDLP